MKMKLLIVSILIATSFSIANAAVITTQMPEQNLALENKCATLPKTAIKEEIDQCKGYHKRRTEAANARVRECGQDQSCLKDELPLQAQTQQSLGQMNTTLEQNGVDIALDETASKAKCATFKAAQKGKIENLTMNGKNELLDSGTPAMKECVILSRGNLRYSFRNRMPSLPIDKKWDELLGVSDACLKDEKICDQSTLDTCVKKLMPKAARCDAAAYLVSAFGRDWESSEHAVTKEVKGGNPAISCIGVGVATVDYDACVKFVQNGDIMDAAQGAVYKGQELYYKDKAMSAQMEVSASDNTGTGALKAMKEGVKGQEDMMTQRAALNTGKFAALVSYYSDIPTPEDIKAKCTQYQANQGITGNAAANCEAVASRQHEFGFLMNQQAKDKMKAKLAKVGIDVASDAMMAALLAKRAKQLDNAIAQVDAFKPIDPLAPPSSDLQTTFCQQNPGDPQCLTGGLERTYDAMGDNVITFGEGGTGVSFANNSPFVDPTAGTIDTTTPGGKKPIGSVGNVITSAQQNGGLTNKAAAATVTKGNAPAGGGGGGAGGGGGGIGGGGGGGSGAGGTPPGSMGAVSSRTPGYNGGAGFSVLGGGFGINKGKNLAKDDSNPFGKLFNNKAKSGALDFNGRAPASVGNKTDNIFEMISKRYTVVHTDKRLLEYELAK